MAIVLPILFFAIGLGLFVRKPSPAMWVVLALWIMVIIAKYFAKDPLAKP